MLLSSLSWSQDAFRIIDGKKRATKSFDLSFNLIKVEAEVNGLNLKFLVDTGLKRTIIFNLKQGDSLTIKEGYRTSIRGFGQEEPIEAIYSKGNKMKLGKLINEDAHIIFLDAAAIDINTKLGEDVNGVIGSDLFRKLAVEVNYESEKLKFYKDSTAIPRRYKRYNSIPLDIHGDKPYVKIEVKQAGENYTVNTLLDTGSSSSFWYYGIAEDSTALAKPQRGFNDYLGWGVSGPIEGWRSKIEKLSFSGVEFKKPTVAFPNDQSLINASENDLYEEGSIGGEILRRTNVLFDYQNNKLFVQPIAKLVDQGFYYNMSGIHVKYGNDNTIIVTQNHNSIPSSENVNLGYNSSDSGMSSASGFSTSFTISYKILPTVEVDWLTKGSPADKVDIREGDVITKINGRNASIMGLGEIAEIFKHNPGKKIRLKLTRQGVELKKQFRLAPLIE